MAELDRLERTAAPSRGKKDRNMSLLQNSLGSGIVPETHEELQIPFEGVSCHSAPISCPTPNFAKGSHGYTNPDRPSWSRIEGPNWMADELSGPDCKVLSLRDIFFPSDCLALRHSLLHDHGDSMRRNSAAPRKRGCPVHCPSVSSGRLLAGGSPGLSRTGEMANPWAG